MEVITTHTNADLDTLASMVAAKRLYPDAVLAFSGSFEKKVAKAIETIPMPYKVESAKDIALDEVTRLILVDVRVGRRIGRFSEIIGRPGLDIHIYDHHPSTDGDIRGSAEVIERCGSTTAILALILRDKGVRLTHNEATLLMAGIYEDTGSLSYPSTTVKDFDASSFLLSSGADLRIVADLLKSEMTPADVSLLNEFLRSEATYTIGGVDIVIAEGEVGKSSGDVASLAHRIRDIEGMDCLFVLAEADGRVHMIARSRTTSVDAGAVARELGGGGHEHAASASFRDRTVTEVKEMLLDALRRIVVARRKAEDIMSFPAIIVEAGTALKGAMEIMRRYNINAAPVVKDAALCGVITRQVVDRAVYHGLGGLPVDDYMTTDCVSVTSVTAVEEIREMVIRRGQRLLPVLKDGKVAGVITRTDLLKLLQDELLGRPAARGEKKGPSPFKGKRLSNLMKERLPGWLLEILKDAGKTADALGVKTYAVGGFVRDLLLRRENLDVDIVVEGGDGIAFAEEFASKRGLRVRPHSRFKTAVVIFPDGFKIDVATARLEYYERPGALPTVEASSLKLDLYRRDFIINTLAIELNSKRFGELVDFFGGERDIKEKTIRVLHNLSFVEDPTRALRAVRFAEKFGFRLERHTANLMKNAVKLDIFSGLKGPRLLEELRNILEEETASKSVSALSGLGLLGLIHKDITWDHDRELFFERTREAIVWHRLLYTKDKVEEWLPLFLALTDTLKEEDLLALVKRFSISGKKKIGVIEARGEGLKALNRINAGLAAKNSGLYELLHNIPLEVILYLIAKTEKDSSRRALSVYVTKSRHMDTVLKGSDIREMGIKEGRAIGEVLKDIFTRRLDGQVATRADEEAIVRTYLKSAARGKGA